MIQGLKNPSLKEKESEDCIHRDSTQIHSTESIKISIFVIWRLQIDLEKSEPIQSKLNVFA